MRKREEFAVSLRKQKTKAIIATRRRRMIESISEQSTSVIVGQGQVSADITRPAYHGYYKFSRENSAVLTQLLHEIAPAFTQQQD